VYPTGGIVAVFNTVALTGGSNGVTIADYVVVTALMIVLILWSATRLLPDYIALATLIMLILWATARLFAQRKF
jgi:prepilin signal peptidase PulO-like enzyme (type II secretory pathway)